MGKKEEKPSSSESYCLHLDRLHRRQYAFGRRSIRVNQSNRPLKRYFFVLDTIIILGLSLGGQAIASRTPNDSGVGVIGWKGRGGGGGGSGGLIFVYIRPISAGVYIGERRRCG